MASMKGNCLKCGKEMASTSVARHMKSCQTEPKPRVKCTYKDCERDFKNKASMMSHYRDIHEENTYTCNRCNESFKKESDLNYHKRVEHKFSYRCPHPTCNKILASKENIRIHINASINRGGHGGIDYTPVYTPPVKDDITINKRKFDEIDPVVLFMEGKKDCLKDSDPTKRCEHEFCTIVRLSYGFVGEDKRYCSKHSEFVPPGMINLGKKTLCKYINCTTKGTFKINGMKFCDTHRKQLVSDGLPSPGESVNKPISSGRKCKHDGCEIYSSFDEGAYCYKHSPTKISDDRRSCEIQGCNNGRPNFGFEGGPRTRCIEHKVDGMYSRKLCSHEACCVSASYGPSGGLPLTCLTHKEDDYVIVNAAKCALGCCLYGTGVQAKFYHPDNLDETSEFFGKRVCYFARRVLIEVAIQNNDMKEVSRIMDYYGLSKIPTLNAQSAFRFECEKSYHHMLVDCVDMVFDGHVHEGPKTLQSKRPDIFYKFNVGDMYYGIQIEYDENNNHEDEITRLECIANDANCTGRVYVIRVNGGHGTKNPICTRVDMTNYGYFVVSSGGRVVASMVADAVIDRIQWIKEGLSPDVTRPSKIIF